MADNIDPPTPPRKGKPGRKPGKQYKASELTIRSPNNRFYTYSVQELTRKRVDPELILEWYMMILMGKNPVADKDEQGNYYIKEDPSPNAPPPTLEQKNAAMRVVLERREGMVPQKVDFTANVASALPPELMAGLNANTLALIAQALALPDPNVIDTEGVEVVPTEGIAIDVPSD